MCKPNLKCRRGIFFVPLLLLAMGTWGQSRYPQGFYSSPLPEPLGLSGSFGEIRSRHFHAGTDLRTGGKEGMPVRAVMDGEIVRINVAVSGYGKAIYIAHPNGSTSVYGHLRNFAPDIAEWVEAEQYRLQQGLVVLYPKPGRFPVKAGQLIGYSGNTGSSGGPHLHFELRYSEGIPYNSYLSGIKFVDAAPPQFRRLYVYSIDSTNYQASLSARREVHLRGKGNSYRVLDTLLVDSVAGLAVEVTDRVNPQSLRCNIASLRMLVGGIQTFWFDTDEVPFPETAYADAHVDNEIRVNRGDKVRLLFQLPGNRFSRYRTLNHGKLTLKKGEVQPVTIEASDAAGNTSQLTLVLKGTGRPVAKRHTPISPVSDTIHWDKGGTVSDSLFSFTLQPGDLYYDCLLQAKAAFADSTSLGPVVDLHSEVVPLHRAGELSLATHAIPDTLRQHLYLARWNARRKHFEYYTKADLVGERAVAKVRDFGRYTLLADTTPPRLESSHVARVCSELPRKNPRMLLRPKDKVTSIAAVEGAIDGQWVLWEFEPKTGEIWHDLDSTRTSKGQSHQLKLRVFDALGNAQILECEFKW